MPCNCGNKSKEFIYTNERGEQQKHPTLVSAKAAKINNGGKGSVREVVKTR